METPNGTKRISGFIIMLIGIFGPMLGYSVSEVAPAEMAHFIDAVVGIVGAGLLLYGEYKAKSPLWFAKVHKENQ